MPLVDLPLPQLYSYAGVNPRPDDFDAFWNEALRELDETEPEVELCPVALGGDRSSLECFDLFFTGVGGARVHAKYVRPRGSTEPHPAVLHFHGYTGNAGDWTDRFALPGALGFGVAAMDCRGQGGQSEDSGQVRGTTHHGHIIRGLDDPDPRKLLFRQIFLDTVQLARVVASFPETDATRIGAQGASQGGALTLACAALAPDLIRRAAPTYPFLCDYQRVWEMDLAEEAYGELRTYFRHFDPRHEREREIFTRLGYVDVQHLAKRIRAEVLMGCGLMDRVCPPSTQFAAYNKVSSKKQVAIYPDFGHEALPGFGDSVFEFMAKL